MRYKKISRCRLCYSKKIKPIIDFGPICLSSVFPYKNSQYNKITPMIFGICKNCKLSQLLHNYDPKELFNDDYGYRSGINKTMVRHLTGVTDAIKKTIKLKTGDYVLDIASNDATLLKSYKSSRINYVGIDPTINKFKKFYPKNFKTRSKLFSGQAYLSLSKKQKAKVITSIAMFYDIQNPNKFVSDIKSILHEKGIWVMEMYYLPILLKYNAYDSICHEHITYLSFNHINYLCKKNNLKIFKTSLNSMNCGSIRYFICHKDAKFKLNFSSIQKCKKLEKVLSNEKCLYNFKKRIQFLSNKLRSTIKRLKENKKTIHIYGASTKGNILIQYTKLTTKEIDFAADRNPLKWNRKMPGSNIPIISENKSRLKNPDAYLVLPWHFKKEFIKREKRFLSKGGQLIFPLPFIYTLSKKNYTRDT